MTEWNKELENKIIRKSRFILMFKIVRILIAVLFIYFIYMMVLSMITHKLDVANENMYYSSLATEWRIPNVRGDYTIKEEELNAFGTTQFSYDLLKKVGADDVVVGEAQITKRLFNTFSALSYSHPGLQQLSDFSFSLPVDPRTNEELDANTSPHVWETLDMLPEGTVAELAFSTPDFMEAEELIESLKEYDLHILWMPLYTGEFIDFEPYGWGSSDDSMMINDVIGLSGGVERDERFRQSLRYTQLEDTLVKESKQLMLKNMEELLKKSEGYYEQFLGLGHLKEKYHYLKEEGFTVYGAVVTGPVKELLKLQDDPVVRGEQLGETALWNWE